MILDEILTNKAREVEERKAAHPLRELDRAVGNAAARPSFATALRQPGVSIIAEIKRRSPSGGELRPDASAADLAAVYATNGAAALSVLTDERFFGGRDQDLRVASAASGLATLRKDFVLDPYQVYETRAIGASALLLIVRALSQSQLVELLRLAQDLGLDTLVETHSEDEVGRALDAGATIVGVNNRDLDRLVTDTSLATRLRPIVPNECLFVAESGYQTPDDLRSLAQAGVDAALIGEVLVRSADPGALLRQMVEAGRETTAGHPA